MTELTARLSFGDEGVLLHELNHRINNEFAAAISAVSVAAARSSDRAVKAALSGVGELLHHYADVHRALQTPDHDTPVDAATYLHQLCVSISRSKLEDMEIKLVLSAQSLQLPAERCWRLGMILYELITKRAGPPKCALLVPQSAIQLDQAGHFVLVVDGATSVELGRNVVVTDGLKEGELVIVEGIQKVHAGQVVSANVAPSNLSRCFPGYSSIGRDLRSWLPSLLRWPT